MFAILSLLLSQALLPTPGRLYPIDDTPRDPGFRSFVGKLRQAVSARDTGALRRLTDREVVVGPGREDKGWAKFTARWQPENPDSRLWDVLADLLSLGFIREHPSLFLSPYLVWRFPRELHPATHWVVVRDGAPLRAEPSLNAPAMATLSFDIVERLGPETEGETLVRWVRVRTLDGTSGFMNRRDLMSPLMPRAQFGQQRGRWVMTALER